MTRTVKVGTRGSPLALVQTELVLKKLRQAHPDIKFSTVVIRTKGDTLRTAEQLRTAGKGLFVKEIEQALLRKTVQMAVHSVKDLPSDLAEGLALGAVLEREDPSDLFIGRRTAQIDKLSPGALVGTASLRRQAFLRAMIPHVEPVDLRGNLDTRLEKLNHPKSKLSGIVVAAAGVRRLMPQHNFPAQLLPKETFVPAPGQGALAIEIRSKDEELKKLLAVVHHELTAAAIEVERAVMRRFEGGCQVPLGVCAEATDDGLVRVTACLASVDGNALIRETATGSAGDPETLAEALETMLKSRGAAEILMSLPGRAPPRASGNGHKARRAQARSRR